MGDVAKMCHGILRYSPNEVAAIIDGEHAGRNVRELIQTLRSVPIVATVAEAKGLGADVFVLGIAAPGGHIPEAWYPAIDEAVALGMCVLNGLHDRLAPRYPQLESADTHHPWIWDVRIEPEGLGTGTGCAASLRNKRLLMIGTDMAIGKMTAGLEIYRAARDLGVKAAFVATGQIGITIMGTGVPLDAVRVDYASGAIEREVMACRDAELVIIEGQGALIHPGSTANLPLLRGSCPTHLVLCHRAGQTALRRLPHISIPPLRPYAELYEDLAEACAAFPRPITAGIALNTSEQDAGGAREAIGSLARETGFYVDDPVRNGGLGLLKQIGFA